jgi:hypothetical protein
MITDVSENKKALYFFAWSKERFNLTLSVLTISSFFFLTQWKEQSQGHVCSSAFSHAASVTE